MLILTIEIGALGLVVRVIFAAIMASPSDGPIRRKEIMSNMIFCIIFVRGISRSTS